MGTETLPPWRAVMRRWEGCPGHGYCFSLGEAARASPRALFGEDGLWQHPPALPFQAGDFPAGMKLVGAVGPAATPCSREMPPLPKPPG